MPETHLLTVDAPEIATQARPGQFCMIHCGEGYLLRRPISVHGVSDGLSFLVKVVGRGTACLSQNQPGDKLNIIGPLGNGFSILPESRKLLLVAGGMGIAPLAFLARTALLQNLSVTILVGVKTKELVYPLHLLPGGVDLLPVTEDGSEGKKGLVTDFLSELATKSDQVFACGPVAMYKAMHRLKVTKPIQVSLEAWMGCGMGACYGCTTLTRQGPKQVCRDGPVFELDDILWDKI
ncbi:MAG: dihydroorotate dehydrogenase electron transfer subunit [Dehalococcoidia bacterium]|nr:dihydroorotate dehydrogenase electron transfer subunit [Dehalococcoidia bacterium]